MLVIFHRRLINCASHWILVVPLSSIVFAFNALGMHYRHCALNEYTAMYLVARFHVTNVNFVCSKFALWYSSLKIKRSLVHQGYLRRVMLNFVECAPKKAEESETKREREIDRVKQWVMLMTLWLWVICHIWLMVVLVTHKQTKTILELDICNIEQYA